MKGLIVEKADEFRFLCGGIFFEGSKIFKIYVRNILSCLQNKSIDWL